MPIGKSKLTKEMIAKAANCNSADELIALAKTEGRENRCTEQVSSFGILILWQTSPAHSG